MEKVQGTTEGHKARREGAEAGQRVPLTTGFRDKGIRVVRRTLEGLGWKEREGPSSPRSRTSFFHAVVPSLLENLIAEMPARAEDTLPEGAEGLCADPCRWRGILGEEIYRPGAGAPIRVTDDTRRFSRGIHKRLAFYRIERCCHALNLYALFDSRKSPTGVSQVKLAALSWGAPHPGLRLELPVEEPCLRRRYYPIILESLRALRELCGVEAEAVWDRHTLL